MRTRVFLMAGAAVLTLLSGCASGLSEAADKEALAHIRSEAQQRASDRSRKYVQCALATAYAYATDASSDSVSAGDIADASLAKCGLDASAAQADMEVAAFANLGDMDASTASARRTMETIRTEVRGQAIGLVIDVRRRKSAAHVREGS